MNLRRAAGWADTIMIEIAKGNALMKLLSIAGLGMMTWALIAGSAYAQEAPAATPEFVALLERLHARDATLKDFVGKLQLSSTNARTGEQKIFSGTVQYKKTNVTNLYIRFDIQKDDTGVVIDKNLQHEIVIDGRWLIDSDGKNKRFVKQELVAPGKTYNPFKLGQGPLPLPIGQPKEDILARFAVTQIPSDAKDPVNTAHLRLVPLNERYQQVYKMTQMDLWIDLAQDLPTKVVRTELGEPADDGSRDTTAVVLKDLQVNTGAAKIPELATPPAGSGWDVSVEAYKER